MSISAANCKAALFRRTGAEQGRSVYEKKGVFPAFFIEHIGSSADGGTEEQNGAHGGDDGRPTLFLLLRLFTGPCLLRRFFALFPQGCPLGGVHHRGVSQSPAFRCVHIGRIDRGAFSRTEGGGIGSRGPVLRRSGRSLSASE